MQVTSVNPREPKPARIAAAAEALRAGGVVALPTETFYGLAVDSSQDDAVEQLNRLKAKDSASPVLLLAADMAQVESVSATLPASFARSMTLAKPTMTAFSKILLRTPIASRST